MGKYRIRVEEMIPGTNRIWRIKYQGEQESGSAIAALLGAALHLITRKDEGK